MAEPEKLMKIGGVGGIISGVFLFVMPLALAALTEATAKASAYQAGTITAEALKATLEAVKTLIAISGILVIIAGILAFMFAIGFIGGGKKFGTGLGTASGVMEFLYGIGLLALGAGILMVSPAIEKLVEALAAESPELAAAALADLTRAAGLMTVGTIVTGVFGFIFGILAMIYFFKTPRGALGGVGGILMFIGAIIGAFIPYVGFLVPIGLILMSVCLLLQAKA